jgi:hypothetical protein
LSGKGFDVIEKVLDRGIGKPDQKVEHSGEIKTDPPIFVFKNLNHDGK